MKARYHHSSRQFASRSPAQGLSQVLPALLVALILFFLLPGLLAAQESQQPQQAPVAQQSVQLNDQAVAAAVAAGQPALGGETVTPQTLSRELRPERLWLLPRHAEFADFLNRAGRQALQHPDCNEVLYGSLNEFKTERIGTSFTILCMKDARTTFNQVFFAADLMSEEELAVPEDNSAADELERLRRMMMPQSPTDSTEPAQPAAAPETPQAAPTVF